MDVIAQRFQRRDVQDASLVLKRPVQAFAEQGIERGEKCSQSLAGTGGRGDERVRPRLDGGPAALLRLGGRAELPLEPLRYDRMKLKLFHRYCDTGKHNTWPRDAESQNAEIR